MREHIHRSNSFIMYVQNNSSEKLCKRNRPGPWPFHFSRIGSQNHTYVYMLLVYVLYLESSGSLARSGMSVTTSLLCIYLLGLQILLNPCMYVYAICNNKALPFCFYAFKF